MAVVVRRCEIVGGVSRLLVATHPTILVVVRRCEIVGGVSRFLVATHPTIYLRGASL